MSSQKPDTIETIDTTTSFISRDGSQPATVPKRKKKKIRVGFWCLCGGIATFLAILLSLGLVLGLIFGRSHWHPDTTGTEPSTSPVPSPSPTGFTNTTGKQYWRPKTGTTWQIVLEHPPKDIDLHVDVYDIDLFDNNATFIQALRNRGYKVICYFSAGSYENWRADANEFNSSDYGESLDGWAGEYWLNTNSANVRRIMIDRLQMAANHDCDGVDPDNVMTYNSNTGFNLSQSDAINYINFLADAAHTRGLAMGLKNAPDIVNQVIDKMDWEVNESCVQYDECDSLQPFIDQGKPVFHIEYPDESHQSVKTMCHGNATNGFSTVIKKLLLTDWVEYCP